MSSPKIIKNGFHILPYWSQSNRNPVQCAAVFNPFCTQEAYPPNPMWTVLGRPRTYPLPNLLPKSKNRTHTFLKNPIVTEHMYFRDAAVDHDRSWKKSAIVSRKVTLYCHLKTREKDKYTYIIPRMLWLTSLYQEK